MDAKELAERLGKLLWCCNALVGRNPTQHPGRVVPESWQYHAQTCREAIKQLTPKGPSNDS